MSKTNYNGNISNMLIGSLKNSTPARYIIIYPSVFLLSLFYCSLTTAIDSNNINAVVIFALISSTLYLLIFIGILNSKNPLDKYECTAELYANITSTSNILEFLPINKESLIKSKCLDSTMIYILFFIPVLAIYLAISPSKLVTVFRAIMLILTIAIIALLTYRNISQFKAVPKYFVKETKKSTSGFISFLKSWAIYSLIIIALQYVSQLPTSIFAGIIRFFESLSILAPFGQTYIGLPIILVAVITTIYFNYFYILKNKLSQLDTVSNWREL